MREFEFMKIKAIKNIISNVFDLNIEKKQVIKINSQWVETLHIYNMEFLYQYN